MFKNIKIDKRDLNKFLTNYKRTGFKKKNLTNIITNLM